jgi:pimeloyl-ACP methyl ester carboxylesterase
MMDATVVLLHGSGLGSWIWQECEPYFSFASLAVDVPSHKSTVTIETCALETAQLINKSVTGNIVLILHSLSGVLVPELSKLLGNRLKACVYVGSVIPKPGRSFAKTMGFPASVLLPVLFLLNPSGLKPSEKMLRAELCNDLDAVKSKAVVENFMPEFRGLFLRPVGQYPDTRSVYIKLSNDKSVSPALQDRSARNLKNAEVVEWASGHLPMLSNPEKFAALLNSLVEDF